MALSIATGVAVVVALALGVAAVTGRRPARHTAPLVAGPAPSALRRHASHHHPHLDAAILRTLRRTPYISQGTRRRNDVALTFDDGPGPSTATLVALLRREHVPATFFVLGRAARTAPELIRREIRAGDVVGDHTVDHPALATLSAAAQQHEIAGAAQDIRAAGAPLPLLFRPPYGSFDATTLGVLARDRMLMVLWTVDTKDFSRPGAARIAYTALSGARAGAIILMHDGGGDRSETIAALPRVVRKLRARGFHLVTVPQLVHDDPPPRDQPAPHSLSGR